MHNSAGSESMMNAADEVGFMLVGESGIRGYDKPEETWDDIYKPAAERAMARAYRGHPSVVRYGLCNEWAEATRTQAVATKLIDAVVSEDPTRLMSFSQDKAPWVKQFFGSDGRRSAWVLDHYHQPTLTPGQIGGVEEDLWDRNGTHRNELLMCGRAAILDRLNGYAVFAPWTLNNYWCNFVAGGGLHSGTVNSKWKVKDRYGNVDGFGGDLVRFVQNCYSVYASADVDQIQNHLGNESMIFEPGDSVPPGLAFTRSIVTFNSSLQSHQMSLHWELRDGDRSRTLLDSGDTTLTTVQPAGHVVADIHPTATHAGVLVLVLQTRCDGATVFTENRYRVIVGLSNALPAKQ